VHSCLAGLSNKLSVTTFWGSLFMFGAAMHYYLSENYFLSGERHHGCRSSEDGYVKRIQELGERKEKVLLNIKEIRRTLVVLPLWDITYSLGR